MNRFAARFSWITAMASLAMMLGIRTLHSPLQHAVECCHTDSACVSSSPAVNSTTCGHSYRAHQHHGHSHTTPVTAEAAPCNTQQHKGHQDSHGHAHDCQLCQFLTQGMQPVELPVLLTGEEAVTAPPVDILPEFVLISLPGPYVRGPPQLS